MSAAAQPPQTPTPTLAFAQALLAEQTRLHGQALGPSLGATLVAAALLTTYLHGFMPVGPLLAWAALLLLAVVVRGGVHLLQRRAALAAPQDPRWRRHHRWTLLLLGCAWAMGALVLGAAPAHWQVEVLVLALVAASALSMVTLSFDPPAALLRGLPALLPLLWLVLTQPLPRWPRGIGVAALVMLVTAWVMRRRWQQLQEALRGQIDQDRHTGELSRTVADFDRSAEIAGVGGWTFDAATRALQLSPQALRLLELPLQPAAGLASLLERLDPADRADLTAALDRTLSTGESFALERPLRSASGRSLAVRLCGEPRRAGDGIVAVDGTLQNVTRQHETDRALADKHRLLEQLLRTVRQGYWFADIDGRCTDLNPAMADLLGRPRDAVIGQPVTAFFEGQAKALLQAQLSARRQGHDGNYELSIERPDGSRRHCLVNGTRLLDAGGQPVGTVGIWTDITERHAVEQAMRVDEVVINASAELISVLDEQETYRLVNEAWCQAFGLRREQVLGRRHQDLVPDAPSPQRQQALRACLDERRHVALRDVVQVPGQPPRTLHIDHYPVALGDDQPRLAALVARDVTQEEAQRTAMETAAEYLRGTLEASGEAIYATDSERDDEPARFANANQLALWKMPPDLQGRLTNATVMDHMRRLLPDPDAVFARMEAIVAAGKAEDDLYLTLLDGRHVKVGFACVHVHGRKLRVWSGRDITAERAAVAAREAAAAEQRAMLENFPGYIAVVDGQDRYLHVNERLAGLMRRPVAEIVGRPATEVLGESRWRKLRQTLEQTRRSGQVVSQTQYPSPDGLGVVDIEVTHVAGPRPADGSAVVYAFGIDVTERKRAQAALIDALAEAERANKAKSQFLSSMSHELRTPLNAVLGFGQLLAQQPLTPPQQHQVTEIVRGGRHLLGLINDLLDLGRIEAGELEMSCQAVDATAVIDECLGLMEPLAREHGVTLRHRTDDASPGRRTVSADPKRLRQVLLNLLSNAVKYNHPGGQVIVDSQSRGERVELRVHDTGPGLSADQQQRLFRPFERLEARRGAVDGTGIGLALSRHLVEAMDGRIGIVSAPGQGSTFWVELPAGGEPAAAPGAGPGAAGQVQAQRLRALYIEDNPVNLMLMAAMLEDELELATESDPLRGLERVRALQPDLVLLDIQLPGIDGYEVLRRLRADESTRAIPVVAVSANAMPGDVAAGHAAGFDAYLTKPVDLGRLLDTVRGVGGRVRGRAAPGR